MNNRLGKKIALMNTKTLHDPPTITSQQHRESLYLNINPNPRSNTQAEVNSKN